MNYRRALIGAAITLVVAVIMWAVGFINHPTADWFSQLVCGFAFTAITAFVVVMIAALIVIIFGRN
jgi:hypothetical protein